MREHLVGYLLGVLDDAEQDLVREQLPDDPRLQGDLERIRLRLAPLESAREQFEPPPGLAERTCARVSKLAPVAKPSRRRAVVTLGAEPVGTRFTAADAVVAIGVVLAASILFFPAIANSRYQARVSACQNSLRQVHVALREYSSRHNNCFPFVPPQGNRAVAGVYAPILADCRLVPEPRILLCPASAMAEQADRYRIPSLEELDRAWGAQLAQLQRTMGGSYGYCLGYWDGERLRAVQDRGRNHFVLMADMPKLVPGGVSSENHGSYGQNVLYEGGAAKYLRGSWEEVSGDDFYLSDRGQVEAGRHANDSVVGNTAASPLLLSAPPPAGDDAR